MTEFSTFEAAKILKLDYTRLNEWLRGYFDPMQRAKGRGTRTRFSLNDLYRLKLLALLVESKVSREMAKDICAKATGADFSKGYVVCGKCILTDSFIFVLSDDPFDLNKVKAHWDKAKKEFKLLFPIQIVISRPVVKELVDSKLP
jgi:hypothetical protein